MATSGSPSSGDTHRESALLAIYWTQFLIAFSLVILRFYARFSIAAIGLDDYAMAVTMV